MIIAVECTWFGSLANKDALLYLIGALENICFSDCFIDTHARVCVCAVLLLSTAVLSLLSSPAPLSVPLSLSTLSLSFSEPPRPSLVLTWPCLVTVR